MVDLSKLSPAPWQVWHDIESGSTYIRGVPDGPPILMPELDDASCHAALGFAVLARNALEVMMRRGWWPMPYKGQWYAAMDSASDDISIPVQRSPFWPRPIEEEGCLWPDPFTALVEADRWYRENVEAQT